MNEYQQQQETRDQQFEAELAAIAGQLGDWSVKPWDSEGRGALSGRGSTWRMLIERDTQRELWCHRYMASSRARIEFKPTNWPTYTDESNKEFTVWPTDLYPKEVTPVCSAAVGRDPKAVANQIGKLLPEYDRIHKLCIQQAEESGSYYAKSREAIEQLCKATGNPYKKGETYHSYFLRGLSDTQSVQFNSVGDVEIRLPAEEMLQVIDLIYKLRTGKPRAQTSE